MNKKGIITANHAGKTKLTATIKYKYKTTAGKKLKTKVNIYEESLQSNKQR